MLLIPFNAEQAKIRTLEKQLQVLGIDPESVSKGNIAGDIAVKAPINGTVGHIIVNTGTYVSTDKPLMEIIDNSKVHADLTVFEKDLFKVKVGQTVRLVLTNQDNREIARKIYGINNSFDKATKGVTVHAVIKNAGKLQLIPRTYIRGLINIGNQVVPVVLNKVSLQRNFTIINRTFIRHTKDAKINDIKISSRRIKTY